MTASKNSNLLDSFDIPCPRDFEPQLSIIDEMMPNILIPYLLIFDRNQDDKMTTKSILSTALHSWIAEFPILAIDAVPIAQASRKDPAKKHEFKHGTLQYKLQDLSCQFSLRSMEEKNFIDKELPLGTFDSSEMPADSNDPVPLCRVKGTFIEGGFVLGICYNHLFGDAFSYDVATSALARHCLAAAKSEPYTSQLSEYSSDRNLLCKQFPDTPQHKLAPCLATPQSPQDEGYEVEHAEYETLAQIYRLSSSSLKSLKAQVNTDEQSHLSTHDAVCALIFRTFARARRACNIISDDDNLVFSIAIDIRSYLPDLPKDWLGNAVSALRMTLSARDVLGQNGLSKIASAIRESIKGVNQINVKDFFSSALSKPGCMLLDNEIGRSSGSTGMMLTTWRNFAPGKYDWPKAIGDFKVMRYPLNWQPMGWIVIWPDMADGTWEISTVMEREVGKHFAGDSEFVKMATPAWQR